MATFYVGAIGAGGGSATTTPIATTPCITAENTCMVASDRPSAPRPVVEVDHKGTFHPPGRPTSRVLWLGWGGGRGRYPPLARPVVVEGGGWGGGLWGEGVGVDRSDPKGLPLASLPMELWGSLPPGASHWQGRG